MDLSSLIFMIAGCVLPSLLVSVIGGYFVRRYAPSWGLVDKPGEARKVHTVATPLGGGLAIAASVLIFFAAFQVMLLLARGGILSVPDFVKPHLGGLAQRSFSLWFLLGSATVLMLLGLVDDRRGVDWRVRLFVQFAVAIAVVWQQDWRLTAFIPIPIVTYALSVIWIVALVNAFNMLDNMDGLSAGVAAICASMLAAVTLLWPDPETARPQLFVAGFLVVLVGALLGFLWHNRPRAKLFMGDAGSYFIGFCIAIATLQATYTGYAAGTPHAVLAPLCILAVPLYDMATVLWIRVCEGRSPFQADRCHFSHRLVDLGLSKTHAVLTIYLLTAACGLGGLLLNQVNVAGAAIIVLLIGSVLTVVAILESAARRSRKG